MTELFLTILNASITAGWLVLAVLLARLLLKKAPAWIKVALWAIVALRLVWPFEIKSMLSLVPSSQTLPPEALYDHTPQLQTGIPTLNAAINPVFGQVFVSEPANSVNPLQVATTVAGWIWFVGMAVMLCYSIVSYLRVRRSVAVSMPVEKGVYLSDGAQSPFILGVLRPRIYLPSHLEEEKWATVLAHERAHLARKDHWWKPLGFFLLTVFWFHPLLWVAYILLCRDVEQACDEKVIRGMSANEKQAYSHILLECSLPKKWISACPLAFGETNVKGRIKAVLHYKKPTLWILIAALLIGSVLAVCFLTERNEHSDDAGSTQGAEMYQTVERLYSRPNISYIPDLDGYFRFGEEETLLFQRKGDSVWVSLGNIEEVTLTEENFDVLYDNFFLGEEFFVEEEPGIYYQYLQIRNYRIHNKRAWRITMETEDYLSESYLLEQNTGEIYLFYWGMHLYRLETVQYQQSAPSVPLPEYTVEYVAGKSFAYEKMEFGWEFTVSLQKNGTFSYSEGTLSSHLGDGNWEVKDGKLYLHEEYSSEIRTFVFAIYADYLAFIQEESHPFTYIDVEDGGKFRYFKDLEYSQNQLIYVNILQTRERNFLAQDLSGNVWVIQYPPDLLAMPEGSCWVNFIGEPQLDADGIYRIQAAECWDYRGSVDSKDVFDYSYFDVDGDGVEEFCYLAPFSLPNITGISLGERRGCKLVIREADGEVYTRSVPFYIVPDNHDTLVSPHPNGSITVINSSYGAAFAFCVNDGRLQILAIYTNTQSNSEKSVTYNIQMENGTLSVEEVT